MAGTFLVGLIFIGYGIFSIVKKEIYLPAGRRGCISITGKDSIALGVLLIIVGTVLALVIAR
jgi:hypothetical protein